MLVFKEKPDSIFSEKYRKIRTNIAYSLEYKDRKKIMVTSAENKDGKSTIACNLALSLVEIGKKVILIDCNFMQSKIHTMFDIENDYGLSEVLTKKINLFDVVKEDSSGLNILTVGQTLDNPSKMISSIEMDNLLEMLDKLYDYIIIDAPSILLKSDVEMLATKCDGTILVVKVKHTKKNKVLECKKKLNELGVNIIGVILNYVKK